MGTALRDVDWKFQLKNFMSGPGLALRGRAGPVWALKRREPQRRPLPGLVIIGAQRAGTTALFTYLSSSPDVAPSVVKEVHYFDRNFARGDVWYRRHFPLDDGRRIGFEGTPYLLFHPLAPERVASTLPETKFVALLRNPIDRAYSHHARCVRLGYESLGFEEAIDAEPARLAGVEDALISGAVKDSRVHREHSYLARGRYAEQLRRWHDHVDPDRILTVFSEDLFADPAQTCAQIAEWAGIAPPSTDDYRPVGTSPGDGVGGALRSRLAAYYAPLNEDLFELVRRRTDWT